MAKFIDCITFFDNNYIFDFRYNVIKNYVDKFIVCESLFDHKNKPKKINFDPEKFISEQVFYTSKDGTKVPMIITCLLYTSPSPRDLG